MKKFLIILFSLSILSLITVYLFIPAKINFDNIIYIKVNINSAARHVYDESKWKEWWPSGKQNSLLSINEKSKIYRYKKYSFTVKRKMAEGMNISIENGSNKISSFLHIIPLNTDSVLLEWKGEIPGTHNPFKMITNYFLAIALEKNISELLQNALNFLESNENLYGLHIIQEKVKDTLLISTRYISKSLPSTETIYNLIKSLKEYISLNDAAETNYPMVNITQDNSIFKTMVAIPIDKAIPQNEKFVLKKMVPGKILVSEVKGGTYIAAMALKQIEIFMDDNHLKSPALHFESLITNRLEETDTSKWVTKIYYPIY